MPCLLCQPRILRWSNLHHSNEDREAVAGYAKGRKPKDQDRSMVGFVIENNADPGLANCTNPLFMQTSNKRKRRGTVSCVVVSANMRWCVSQAPIEINFPRVEHMDARRGKQSCFHRFRLCKIKANRLRLARGIAHQATMPGLLHNPCSNYRA